MPRLVPEIAALAIDAALNAMHVDRAVVVSAYAAWERSAPAGECRFGREQAIAIDCDCGACVRLRLFRYFDQVRLRGQ